MSINNIENLESASSVRTKLNEVIALINIYSASIATGSSYAFTSSLYDNNVGTPMGVITQEQACTAYSSGTAHTAYVVKGVGNTAPAYPETGDIFYYDAELSNFFPSNYYGWLDTATSTNKVANIGASGVWGAVSDICGGGGGSDFSATVYSSGPAVLTGFGTGLDACNGIANNYQNLIYVKDNTAGGGDVITAGDVLYTDYTYTTPWTNPTPVFLGYQITAINYNLYVAPDGTIIAVNPC
jgi:hypothetical protein